VKRRIIPILIIIFAVAAFLIIISVNAGQKKEITLVYSNKVNYEPFIIAKEKGFFREEGLNVDVKIVGGGIQAAESLFTGSADAGAMGDAPAVILMSKKVPLKIVARYGEGEKIHRLLASIMIKDPKELEGKRVGIQFGSSTHGGFILWAKETGLNVRMINMVPLSPLDFPEAMNTNQIDAMAGSEPWPTNVEMLCKDKVYEMADFSGLGNTFPHVFMVTERLIAKHPEDVKKLVRAIRKGTAYINDNMEQAARITSKYIGLPLSDQIKCTARLSWNMGWKEKDLKSMQKTAEFLKEFGKINNIPNIIDFVNTRYLKANNRTVE
jgi:ABC-type nitrate/sulfonate/bicarbonate transport system substrate-binding protein